MVPIPEMTDVMKVVKEVVSVKPKQWVRLKRGICKDDLAQVLSCFTLFQLHEVRFHNDYIVLATVYFGGIFAVAIIFLAVLLH